MTKNSLRVAVLGASGIGKNHARWLHHHGCEVVAFLGTSTLGLAVTTAKLSQEFPFEGRGYTDLSELLAWEKPDAVVVSTPPELHQAQVKAALEAGAHVLCEKPLVDDPTLNHDTLRAQAQELVQLARERERVFAVQTQYAALVPDLLQLCGLNEAREVHSFEMEMDTRNPNAVRSHVPCAPGRPLWIDLAPHPISALLALGGQDATLEAESAISRLTQNEGEATFVVRRSEGATLNAHVRVALKAEGSLARRVALNGRSVQVAGRANAAGQYRIFLTDDAGQEHERADLVDATIGAFVRACHSESQPFADGAAGARNLDWCLRLLGWEEFNRR